MDRTKCGWNARVPESVQVILALVLGAGEEPPESTELRTPGSRSVPPAREDSIE
jgi:hypothetical protein